MNDGSEKPKLTDCADSTQVEQFADYMLGAWREELGYVEDQELPASTTSQMGLALLKTRNGPTAEWSMGFDKRSLRLTSDYAEDLLP